MRWSPLVPTTALLLVAACGDPSPPPTGPDPETVAAAAGSLVFRQLSASSTHACGVTEDDRAWCWGLNYFGNLGNGSFSAGETSRPVAAAPNLRFLEVRAGVSYSCGLTTENRVFCWGLNTEGQLGIGTTAQYSDPVPLAGSRRFRAVRTGAAHACAITLADVTFCWGLNSYGQLGDGTTSRRSRPTLVAGGLAFSGVSAGGSHTCGVTTANRAYCWGWNYYGNVGDGTTGYPDRRTVPTAVAGGIGFDRIVAALGPFSCGAAVGGRGYCWGQNLGGYLGDGTTSDRAVPTPIADPL